MTTTRTVEEIEDELREARERDASLAAARAYTEAGVLVGRCFVFQNESSVYRIAIRVKAVSSLHNRISMVVDRVDCEPTLMQAQPGFMSTESVAEFLEGKTEITQSSFDRIYGDATAALASCIKDMDYLLAQGKSK